MLVQIALSIEDDRSQNPALTAVPVNAGPLVGLVPKIPKARVMLLNSGSHVLGANPSLLQGLAKAGVHFEIATLEGVAGIESLLQRAPGIKVSFGSHAPYFYFEAALLKLQESALTDAQLTPSREVSHRSVTAVAEGCHASGGAPIARRVRPTIARPTTRSAGGDCAQEPSTTSEAAVTVIGVSR